MWFVESCWFGPTAYPWWAAVQVADILRSRGHKGVIVWQPDDDEYPEEMDDPDDHEERF